MSKRAMAVALAVFATALVAVPAAMAEWKHHQTPIQQNKQVQITGSTKFSSGTITVECKVTSVATLEPKTTGIITQYQVDLDVGGSLVTGTCLASGGAAGCQIHTMQPTGLPWPIHDQTADVLVTSGSIHHTMTGGFCAYNGLTVTGGTVKASPVGGVNTVAEFNLSGTVQGHAELNAGGQTTTNMTVSGLWVLTAGGSTYSL